MSIARVFMDKTKWRGEKGAREWAYGYACARDQDDIVAWRWLQQPALFCTAAMLLVYNNHIHHHSDDDMLVVKR